MNASYHLLVRAHGRGSLRLIRLALCASALLLAIISPSVVTAGPQQAPAAPDYPRYCLINLGTLGAPNGAPVFPGVVLNNHGDVIAQAGTSTADPYPIQSTGDRHMNTTPPLPPWMSGRRTALGVAVSAVLGIASVPTYADQSAASAASSRVADISLADLNLSTPAGMSAARERLHTMAERICAEHTSGFLPNFASCVDSTLAGALGQIDGLNQIQPTLRHSVTRAANVSLADLDLSTPEGSRAAHERLETMARRLCTELARDHKLTYRYRPNYAACVHDTLVGAWAQANVIRAANEKRTAQRVTP